ncbi:MAG: methionyl-tRNA formyltransferase, partial [Candidatus Margulisiibacteriota bacterium]
MKIIFMGTPEQAAQILEDLISAKHEILCVITQPDRPKGRGQKLSSPPVKEIALKHSLPLEQPEKVGAGSPLDIARGKFVSLLESLRPDVIVVVAYGKILPKEIIDIPKYGCINVHASLLPKYRGAA